LSARPSLSSSHAAPLVLNGRDVSVERGERTILSHVSFRVAAGQALILTGANGSGKTTLLRAIAGFLPPSSGTITLGPETGDETDAAPIAQRCHLIGHLDGLKGQLTVTENLAFWADFLGDGTADEGRAIQAALAAFDLGALAHIPAAYLSAGQKRRLGLARLLVTHRPLWLLDEPSVSLDAASADQLRAVMAGHLARGGLIVAATHVPLGIAAARELRLGEPGTGDGPGDAR
jgi:heme exporter protein A